MNDLISQIERGEKTVTVGIKNRNKTPQEKNDAAEFLRLARKGQQGDWIPVTPETMPENLKPIFLYNSEVEYPLAGWLQGERWVIVEMDRTFPLKAFNFWMPLPAPPEQREGR